MQWRPTDLVYEIVYLRAPEHIVADISPRLIFN
jgi:hypothetical protein